MSARPGHKLQAFECRRCGEWFSSCAVNAKWCPKCGKEVRREQQADNRHLRAEGRGKGRDKGSWRHDAFVKKVDIYRAVREEDEERRRRKK